LHLRFLNLFVRSNYLQLLIDTTIRQSDDSTSRKVEGVSTRNTEGKRSKFMARYGTAASKTVKSAMHRRKKGTLKSGKGGKAGTVKSRKQAIAIGLSEARKKGAKVPAKKSSS
jgi:hypothetical protein